jgi:hypothetical protein
MEDVKKEATARKPAGEKRQPAQTERKAPPAESVAEEPEKEAQKDDGEGASEDDLLAAATTTVPAPDDPNQPWGQYNEKVKRAAVMFEDMRVLMAEILDDEQFRFASWIDRSWLTFCKQGRDDLRAHLVTNWTTVSKHRPNGRNFIYAFEEHVDDVRGRKKKGRK